MIKLIAALAMTVDHMGYVLFPEMILFRIVGRISMPLYAYSVARGYAYSSKNKTLNILYKYAYFFSDITASIPSYGRIWFKYWLYMALFPFIAGIYQQKTEKRVYGRPGVSGSNICREPVRDRLWGLWYPYGAFNVQAHGWSHKKGKHPGIYVYGYFVGNLCINVEGKLNTDHFMYGAPHH